MGAERAGATVGLLLAAGAGRRMGGPKALVLLDGQPLVRRGVDLLLDGGCAEVLVTVGAAADDVRRALGSPEHVTVVDVPGWAEGMGASLRAGLEAALRGEATVAVVSLVDLVDLDARVVRRLVDTAGGDAGALVRAAYGGVAGHPVVLGRAHWPGVVEVATGDRGARDYLRAHRPLLVECGDLASGRDADTPADLPHNPRHRPH